MHTPMSVCPICGMENIASDKERCPQCDADLTCFKVLDSLPDNLPGERQNPRNRIVLFVVLGLTIILLGALFSYVHYHFRALEARLADQNSALVAFLKNIDTTLVQISTDRQPAGPSESKAPPAPVQTVTLPSPAEMPADIDAKASVSPEDSKPGEISQKRPPPPAKPVKSKSKRRAAASEAHLPLPAKIGPRKAGFWIYRSDGRDTMWSLAERYYGAGRLYPVLMEHNPKVGIFHIKGGTAIRILKEPDQAKYIYPRIVSREGDRLYWYYTVSGKDTVKSIANRFLRGENRLKHMPRPGQKIRIPLE